MKTSVIYDQTLEQQVMTLEKQLLSKQSEQQVILNNLQRRNRELKIHYQFIQTQQTDSKKEVLQAQTKQEHYQFQFENLQSEFNDQNKKIQILKKEIEIFQQEIKQLKQELKEDQLIEQEIQKRNMQIKQLHDTINEQEKHIRLLQFNKSQQKVEFNQTIKQCSCQQQQQQQQQETITIPVYIPIIETQAPKVIDIPKKQYQVQRIDETQIINQLEQPKLICQPIHQHLCYQTQQHHHIHPLQHCYSLPQQFQKIWILQ